MNHPLRPESIRSGSSERCECPRADRQSPEGGDIRRRDGGLGDQDDHGGDAQRGTQRTA